MYRRFFGTRRRNNCPSRSGSRRGKTGKVDSMVFQKTMDNPDEYHHGYHVILDDGTWVTVRRDQVTQWVD